MKSMGVVPHIHELPPFDDFWLLAIVSNYDLTKYENLFNTPVIWVYAIADKIKSEQSG